ncbi:MAG: Gfo/Idh/MocA family oxidoreductase [Verrucomicrobiota bacterium]
MNVAITGTGFMGAVHAEALHRLAQINLVGIQGSSPEKSHAAAERLAIPRAYETWRDLVSDPDIDAVHITTPNRLHFSQTVEAIEAGKHVLCEKPLAMTTEESSELVRLAEKSGLVAAVNYNIRFYPLNLEAKARVRRGDLGHVHSITGSYQQDWLLHETDYNWRVIAEEQGELRAVADIGTHWIDLVQNITGLQVVEIFADIHTLHAVRKRPSGEVETFSGKVADLEATEPVQVTTDDIGCLVLRFDGGARGVLFVSQVTPGKKNSLRYEIAGSRATIEFDSEKPNSAWIGSREEQNQILLKDPGMNAEMTRHYTDYPGGHAEGFPDTFKMCFRSFYEAVQSGEKGATSEFASFQDGHREIELCEAVVRSARKGSWVRV